MSTERLTKAVNVLSWDCGLSNLAYCLVEYVDDHEQEFKVRLWENFSLNEQDVTEAVVSLVRELDARPWMVQADHVCIESQLFNNVTMKIISHALQTYFVTKAKSEANKMVSSNAMIRTSHGPKVHFVAPQNKFKVCSVPEPKGAPGHARNKRVAIAMAKKMLSKQKDRATLEYMESHKKQDDLADSMLQGIYFLRTLRKKRAINRTIQEHMGHKREIIITETSDAKAEKMPHVYRSANFSVPAFDVDGESVHQSTVYRRQAKLK